MSNLISTNSHEAACCPCLSARYAFEAGALRHRAILNFGIRTTQRLATPPSSQTNASVPGYEYHLYNLYRTVTVQGLQGFVGCRQAYSIT